MYHATKGKDAFLNGKRIHTNEKNHFYFVVGLDMSGISQDSLQRLVPIISASNHIRHFGAVALELAIFARGLVDVFIDIRDKLRITDVAAGYLIALEAGGYIIDKFGKSLDSDLSYESRISFVAAANKEFLDDIVKKLKISK